MSESETESARCQNVGIIFVWRVNLVRISSTLTVCTDSQLTKNSAERLCCVLVLFISVDSSLPLSSAVCLCQSLTHSEGLHDAFRCTPETLKSTLLRTPKDMCANRDAMVHLTENVSDSCHSIKV